MKMYNKPTTEILSVNTERMMQDVKVSINQGTEQHPVAGAPRHGTVIP